MRSFRDALPPMLASDAVSVILGLLETTLNQIGDAFPTEAVTAWGAVMAMRDARHESAPDTGPGRERAKTMADLRRRMTDDGYANAWNAGRTMTLDQTVDSVVALIDLVLDD